MPSDSKIRLPHCRDRAIAPLKHDENRHRSTPTLLTTLNRETVINLGAPHEHGFALGSQRSATVAASSGMRLG